MISTEFGNYCYLNGTTMQRNIVTKISRGYNSLLNQMLKLLIIQYERNSEKPIPAVEKILEKTLERVVERYVEKSPDNVIEKSPTRINERSPDIVVEKATESITFSCSRLRNNCFSCKTAKTVLFLRETPGC